MIAIGYVQWVAYWAINSILIRWVQLMYPDSTLGKTLAAMQ